MIASKPKKAKQSSNQRKATEINCLGSIYTDLILVKFKDGMIVSFLFKKIHNSRLNALQYMTKA